MIKDLAHDLASEMGMQLSEVSVIEGRDVGCLDAYLLRLTSGVHIVNALAYQSDIDELQRNGNCNRLGVKIRDALSRLQILLEP
jgi:hypothetical protein